MRRLIIINSSSQSGAALYFEQVDITLSSITFTNNSCNDIFSDQSDINISDSAFTNNTQYSNIYAIGSSIRVDNTSFVGNLKAEPIVSKGNGI